MASIVSGGDSNSVAPSTISQPAMYLIPADVTDLGYSGLYTAGWNEVSSAPSCVNPETCGCLGSGKCNTEWFYHYLERSTDVSPSLTGVDGCDTRTHVTEDSVASSDFSYFDEDICCEDGVLVLPDQSVTCEEIPIMTQTLGSSYTYATRMLKRGYDQLTMLSFCNGERKTAFFNTHAHVTAINARTHIGPEVCGVTIGEHQDLRFVLKLHPGWVSFITECIESLELVTYTPADGSQPILIGSSECCTCPPGGVLSLFPIPTAVDEGQTTRVSITCSIVMRPVSRYGGSYPSFRELFLIIHNVKSGYLCTGSVQEM